MSAVEASSVRVSTMADGTLRIVCDIEPRHAQAAFALFGAPGTALAIAALVPEHARHAEPEPAPKGGQIAKWLGIRCGEREFQDWLAKSFPAESRACPLCDTDARAAAHIVRAVCGVESRREFDNDPAAADRFHRLIRSQWAAYQQSRGDE